MEAGTLPDTPLCLDAEDGISTSVSSPKLYMLSGLRVPSKVTRYWFDSNPLDTVVRAKVLKPSPDDPLCRPRAQLPASRTTC